jgi:transcriptional regulator with XRE-family HTH domain
MNATSRSDTSRRPVTQAVRFGEYLRARRSLVRPGELGFPSGPDRRVPGLRREEVAAAAGISPEYYLRLEQGRDHQPSQQVLAALASVLRLDAHGVRHMHQLVHPPVDRPTHAPAELSPAVLALVDQVRSTAAVVLDRNQDVLLATDTARALAPWARVGANQLVALFDEPIPERADDWSGTAAAAVAAFRRDGVPEDPRFQQVLGQLSGRSPEFERLWSRHDVGPLVAGTLRAHVEPFGALEMWSQPFAVPESAQTVVLVSAEPGSPAAAALAFLAVRPAVLAEPGAA